MPSSAIARGWPLQLVAVSVVVIGVTGADARRAQTPTHTRSVHVSALDGNGAPVAGLTAADVSIKEENQPQPILSFSPATAKMSIALLVDDGGLGINDFRVGIARFMNRLLGYAEFSLVGIAGQNQTLMPFTDRDSTLVGTVRALRTRGGQLGQHLVEAVLDALTEAEKREAIRPVVVVLTNQTRESGNKAGDTALDRLARTGALLHVVEIMRSEASTRDMTSFDSPAAFSRANDAAEPDRGRSQVLGDGPKATGGRRQELVAWTGVSAAMASIAEELAGQYVIEFGSTAKSDATSKIAITTTRPGVKLHAPARATNRTAR